MKRVCETTKPSKRNHYITMRDINRIQQIVQDEDIRLNENDAISIKVWATRLQQEVLRYQHHAHQYPGIDFLSSLVLTCSDLV